MSKREAYKIVLKDLKKCDLFCGKYDATNGNEDFMYGIETVMEVIAFNARDFSFDDKFLRNMEMSIRKGRKKKSD